MVPASTKKSRPSERQINTGAEIISKTGDAHPETDDNPSISPPDTTAPSV